MQGNWQVPILGLWGEREKLSEFRHGFHFASSLKYFTIRSVKSLAVSSSISCPASNPISLIIGSGTEDSTSPHFTVERRRVSPSLRVLSPTTAARMTKIPKVITAARIFAPRVIRLVRLQLGSSLARPYPPAQPASHQARAA